MTLPHARRLVAGLVAAAAATGATMVPAGAASATAPREIAQLLDLDIFKGRRFPIRTCEVRCQEARNRCEDRARNSDDRRDCRLEYGVCSNDCNVYDSR